MGLVSAQTIGKRAPPVEPRSWQTVRTGCEHPPVSDRVLVSIDGGIADVRLNRPDKLNALDPAMFAAVAEAGESLKGDPSVRAVVLSGEGRGFCAGLDFSAFQSMGEGADA